MISIIGQLATSAGQNLKGDPTHQAFDRYLVPGNGMMPFTQPAARYAAIQPAPLAIHVRHQVDTPVGDVVWLERSCADGLLVAMRCDDDIAQLLDGDDDWFLSDTSYSRSGRPLELVDTVITEVSLTPTPAGVGLQRVRWSRADLAHDGGGQPHDLPLRWRDTWARARTAASAYRYRSQHTLDIVDTDEPPVTPAPTGALRRPPAPALRSTPNLGRTYRHRVAGSLHPVDWIDVYQRRTANSLRAVALDIRAVGFEIKTDTVDLATPARRATSEMLQPVRRSRAT